MFSVEYMPGTPWKRGESLILPAKMPLDETSWRGIQEVSRTGMARRYWKVGDTKTITLQGRVGVAVYQNYKIDCVILGFDHNPDLEGKNRIQFGIGFRHGVSLVGLSDRHIGISSSSDPGFRMNMKATNIGGWVNSYMRNQVLGAGCSPLDPKEGTFLAAMPRALREVMKPIMKYTDNEGHGNMEPTDITATMDSIWLPSEFEVLGMTANYSSPFELKRQVQYEFFTNRRNKIFHQNSMHQDPVCVWTRSPYKNSSDSFCRILKDGAPGAQYATFSNAIFVCFAV